MIKQLKTEFPYWRRLTKPKNKESPELALQVVTEQYDQSQTEQVPLHELTDMPAPPANSVSLAEMRKSIEERTRGFLPFAKDFCQRHLKDRELGGRPHCAQKLTPLILNPDFWRYFLTGFITELAEYLQLLFAK